MLLRLPSFRRSPGSAGCAERHRRRRALPAQFRIKSEDSQSSTFPLRVTLCPLALFFFSAFSLTWGLYDQHSLGTQFSLSTGQCIWGASCFEACLESGCCLAQGPSEARVCLCLLGPLPGTDWTLPPRRHRPRSPRWPRAAGPKAACWAFPFSRGPGLFSSASASFAWRSAAGGRGVSAPAHCAVCRSCASQFAPQNRREDSVSLEISR